MIWYVTRIKELPDTHEWKLQKPFTYEPSFRTKELCDWDRLHESSKLRKINRKTILPVLLLLSLFLVWCSNFDQSAQLRIQELEKQAIVAKSACDNLENLNKDINNLKGYIGNQKQTVPVIPTGADITKPQSCTKWYALCVDNKGEWVFDNVCYEDYTFKEWANYFQNYEGAYVNDSQKCLIKENEEELNRMLDEKPVF